MPKEKKTMPITITLQDDEALVLFELLASEKLIPYVDTAERNSLWVVEGQLEKQIAGIFSPDYSLQLESARLSIVAKYGE